MPQPVRCDLCGRSIPPHVHYVVRIEVFADPSLPALSKQDVEEMDFDTAMAHLIEEIKGLSEEELQDQVYRRFEYRLCRSCHIRFLTNPLGRPRHRGEGVN